MLSSEFNWSHQIHSIRWKPPLIVDNKACSSSMTQIMEYPKKNNNYVGSQHGNTKDFKEYNRSITTHVGLDTETRHRIKRKHLKVTYKLVLSELRMFQSHVHNYLFASACHVMVRI